MPDTDTIEPLRLPIPRRHSSLGTGGYELSGTQSPMATGASAARAIVRGATLPAPIEIDKLYPADKTSTSDLIAALGLLAEAVSLLERARTAARGKEMVVADRYTQRFQMLLPDLFARRKIGDGYGAVINSLHFALINQHGRPLSFEQLTTTWRVAKELRNAPFTPFEQALRFVQELEDCHLQVYPAAISELIEEPEDE
jgi:hypothetical protein